LRTFEQGIEPVALDLVSLRIAKPTKDQRRATLTKDTTEELSKVIHIDEARVRDHLGELVRGSVEESIRCTEPVW
jgi:hypothetical protein